MQCCESGCLGEGVGCWLGAGKGEQGREGLCREGVGDALRVMLVGSLLHVVVAGLERVAYG